MHDIQMANIKTLYKLSPYEWMQGTLSDRTLNNEQTPHCNVRYKKVQT